MEWLITNNKEFTDSSYNDMGTGWFLKTAPGFLKAMQGSTIQAGVKGYIIHRQGYHTGSEKLVNHQLVISLFEKYGKDFTRYIKGKFQLMLVINETIIIASDHNGFEKWFSHEIGGRLIYSDDISPLIRLSGAKIEPEMVVVFSLMNHVAGSRTLYSDIFFSQPASMISFDQSLYKKRYWKPETLFNRPVNFFDTKEISRLWKNLVLSYIDNLNIEKPAITLTGGNDSRMVLASLLGSGIKPIALTYGNARSKDGYISGLLAKRAGLNSYISDKQPEPESVKICIRELIGLGNSLVNLHRLHRFNAVKELAALHSPDALFTGLMGGEYIKGMSFDDYIIPVFIRLWEARGRKDEIALISSLMDGIYLKSDEVDFKSIAQVILSDEMFRWDRESERHFLYAFYMYGTIHHYQDTTLFSSFIQNTISPFTDVDFLEILASTPFFSPNRLHSFSDRLRSSKLQVEVADNLAPGLSDIPYAKKGLYTARDFRNPLPLFIIKRIIGELMSHNFPPNYPMGNWTRMICEEELQNPGETLSVVYNLPRLKQDIILEKGVTEKAWHKYTNALNVKLIEEVYG